MRNTLLLFVLLSLASVGCGSSSSSVTASIGAAGGTVSLAEGRASVRVPAGALSASTDLTIAEIQPTGLGALPAGATAIGPYIAVTPHGTEFETPVTIDVPYTSDGSNDGVTVMRIDSPSDTSWAALPEAELNGTRAVFPSEHFSIIVVTRYDEPCGTDLASCCDPGSLPEADDTDGDGCIGVASVLPCVAGICGGALPTDAGVANDAPSP